MIIMKKKFIFLLFLCTGLPLYAQEEDIFKDVSLGEIEYDPDFVDDFDAIASVDSTKGLVLPHRDQLWDKRGIIRREKSLSVMGGGGSIANVYHAQILPEARFEFSKIYGHLGVPLNFPIYDGLDEARAARENGFMNWSSMIKPRDNDFRSLWDAQKLLRHAELGRIDDPYYLRLSRNDAVTLGRGELVRSLAPDYLYDQDYLFAYGHAQFDTFDLRAFLAPVPKINLFGASTRFAPFTKASAARFFREGNLEFAYAADYAAPGKSTKEGDEYILDAEGRAVLRSASPAQGLSVGLSSSYVPIPWLSLTPYTSYGHLFLGGEEFAHGGGAHVGTDLGLHFSPLGLLLNVMLRTEGRLFGAHYWPGYFGRTYMVDRLVLNDQSKAEVLRAREGLGYGYVLELKFLLDTIFDISIGYENAKTWADNSEIPFMRTFYSRAHTKIFDLVKLALEYEVTNLKSADLFFDIDDSRALISMQGQMKLLPFLYLDAWAKHAYGVADPYGEASGKMLSSKLETRALNFGLGASFSMSL